MALNGNRFGNDNAFMRGFDHNAELNSNDLERLSSLCATPKLVPRGTQLYPNPRDQAIIVLDGYCSSYRALANGKQVIFDFRVPGDVVCLRSVILGRSHQQVAAETEAVVCFVPADRIRSLLAGSDTLRRAFISGLDDEDRNFADRFVHIARGSAVERTAALIFNLWKRLDAVGLVDDMSFPLAITQDAIADALGLTSVHVSRILRYLREEKIATIARGKASIHDVDALVLLFR